MKLYPLHTPPISVYPKRLFSALNDIAVFEVDVVNDRFKVADIIGNERTAYRWLKVRYDKDGDAYIFTKGERRYLYYFE